MAFSSLTANQMVSDTEAGSGGFTLKASQSHTTTNVMMTKDAANTKYNLNLGIQTVAGNQLMRKDQWASGDTIAPSVPTGLVVNWNNSTKNGTLTWNASSDTGGSGMKEYEVSDSIGAQDRRTTVTSSPYTFGGIANGNGTYTLVVRSRDNAGNTSAWSSSVSYTRS